MIIVVVLSLVCLLSVSAIAFAYRQRALLLREVNGVISGIERRTEIDGNPTSTPEFGISEDLELLLDEAVQPDSQQLAIVAVNELTGRAGLARSRALLISRGLPRIALLSGGGGAFVVAALGNFSNHALVGALVSVALGFIGALTSHGLSASCRRLAKRYVGILDVLAREVEQHFAATTQRGGPSEDP